MPNFFHLVLLLATAFLFGCDDTNNTQTDDYTDSRPFFLGAHVLLDNHLNALEGKRVGLVGNPTSRIEDGHLVDVLISNEVNITALFAPEHGFRGDRPAGEEITDGIDNETGIKVFSLYGRTRKPTPDMLDNVDVLIFDIQDVGTRFYTYISTLGLVLEAAFDKGIPVWVLDRPNPLGGEYVSGWIREEEFDSFVGAFPIPVVHGLTIGELAKMMIGKEWVNVPHKSESLLTVIPMEGWSREMIWPDTGLQWVPPSPNLPHFTNALIYPGTCFFEGTTLSEGRGTPDPFMIIGSPTLEIDDVALKELQQRYPVLVEVITFTPQTIPGFAVNPKHEGRASNGVRLTPQTLNPVELQPLEFGLELMRLFLDKDSEASTNRFLYNLSGTRKIDDFLYRGEFGWEEAIEDFLQLREPYLIY